MNPTLLEEGPKDVPESVKHPVHGVHDVEELVAEESEASQDHRHEDDGSDNRQPNIPV